MWWKVRSQGRLVHKGRILKPKSDQNRLETLSEFMNAEGYKTEWHLGSGDPASELARMINRLKVDVVIAGSHGHSGVSD